MLPFFNGKNITVDINITVNNITVDINITVSKMDGWCEGGVRQQRNDGGGCATMRYRPENVESPGTYVTE